MKNLKKKIALLLVVCLTVLLCPANAGAITNNVENTYTEKVAFSSIETLPDGGLDYTFFVEGIENHYYVPPVDFNPLTATDETLAMYAFPARPSEENTDDYTEWVERMKNYTGTPLPEIEVTVKPNTTSEETGSINSRAVSGTKRSINWSGYLADLGANSKSYYTQVQVDYTHPTISDLGGSSSTSYWIGLGGYNTGKLVQAGTATTNTALHYAWYEYLSDTGTSVAAQHISSLTISPGDKIYVYISFQKANGKFNYYIANNTTGKSASGLINLPSATQFDGTTAEWVIERGSTMTTSGSHMVEKLGNYGQVTMKNCKATKSSGDTWYDLNSLNPVKIVMYDYNSDNILSEPGSITSNNRFTSYFRNYGSFYIIPD